MAVTKETITRVGQEMEKKEPSYAAGANVKWHGHFGEQFGYFFKSHT